MVQMEKLTPKMTSLVTSKSRSHSGFTLLELILVMAVIAIIAGTAVSFVFTPQQADHIALDRDLKLFVRNSRQTAVYSDTSVYLFISHKGIRRSGSVDKESASEWLHFPEGTTVKLQQNGQWNSLNKQAQHRYLISRSGLCEPINLKISIGKSEFEYAFQALNAFSELK